MDATAIGIGDGVGKKMARKKKAEIETVWIDAIKGFDRDFKCRGFQFEVGKTYEHEGDVEICASGFHAVEGHPLDVLGYYAPGISRYALVKMAEPCARHSEDSKVASARIKIEAEIALPEIIDRAVSWVFARAKKTDSDHATGEKEIASSTGDYGAASSTGHRGAAMAVGFEGRVMGAEGNALFLVRRNDDGEITHAWSGIAGRDGVKPLVWYTLDANGAPEEAS